MESRFTSFLSTNYVPSNTELDEIRNLLIDPYKRLSRLDSDLVFLQNNIDRLFAMRNQLHADIVRHANLTAPLRRIPEELLQEIFFHCLPIDHNAVMSCHEAPLLLGRICSHWRSISLSTPRLWSGIHIVVMGGIPPWPHQDPIDVAGPDLDRPVYNTHAAIEAWLNRSGDLPLSISLYQAPYSYTPREHMENLMSTLIRFSSRWKNVSLAVSSPLSLSLSSLSHGAVPLLETLFFHSTESTPSPQTGFTPLDIFRAPRIRTLSYHLGVAPEEIGWSRLTSLCLESCGHGPGMLTPSKAMDVMSKCPNLVHCRLEFVGGWEGFPSFDEHGIVTMPLLETLSVYEGTLALGPFFKNLRLPILTHLEFATSPPLQVLVTNDVEEPSICTLLSRLDSLQKLTLLAMNITDTVLMSCLRCAHSITQLSILSAPQNDSWPYIRNPRIPFNDEVVALLTPVEGQPLVCPLLKVLECNPCIASDPAVLSFIQQRTIHASAHDVPPLERIDMIFHRQKETDILSTFPPHILDETTITVEYFTPPVVLTHIMPGAGLEQQGRLRIPTKVYRYLHH